MTDGILNIRYCRKCKKAYDIGINYDLCPTCRFSELNKKLDKFSEERGDR